MTKHVTRLAAKWRREINRMGNEIGNISNHPVFYSQFPRNLRGKLKMLLAIEFVLGGCNDDNLAKRSCCFYRKNLKESKLNMIMEV